ncbi:MAG: nucleotide exchange factor GrpE [Marinilabiliales bacterium]|nr:MAG: nucleotide exchange factor GrpE [Marinilabiliales bacterium]
MGKKGKEDIKTDESQMEDVSFEAHEDEEFENQSKENEKENKSKKKSKSKKKTDKDLLAEYEEKCTELNDKYLRLYSEFDNYRKRTSKERLDLLKTASQDIMVELLPVLDDFDRAIAAMNDNNAQEESVKGVELIFNKLFTLLKQKGLEPMDAQGKEFDTDYHEAITNIPAPSDDMKGKVIDVIQKGYLLNGKIIRFAKVVVGN